MSRVRSRFLFLAAIFCIVKSAPAAPSEPPVFRGSYSQFTLLAPLRPAPKGMMQTLDGTERNLGPFQDRTTLLNFWATWCRPCIEEMPSLDRLASAGRSDRLAILSVSVDEAGPATVRAFLTAHRIANLPVFLDPRHEIGSLAGDSAATDALPVSGLPITYVIDKRGMVRGYLLGAAKWDSPAAQRLLDYFMDESSDPG